MSASAAASEPIAEPGPTPAPELERSGPPSLISRVFAVIMRLTLRPWIAFNVWLSALIVRLGPPGIEMWPVWTKLTRLCTDTISARAPIPRGTTVERVALPNCAAELVRARDVTRDGPYILYFHGGGYVACGLNSHRRLVARLSQAADATVLNVNYRLLPFSPITLAIDDAVDGYRKLLDDGVAPGRIVFAGDSAGGGLSFLAAAAVRDRGLPVPAGIVGISPWTEFDPAGKLAHRNVRTDPLIPVRALVSIVEVLIAKGAPIDPLLSPVNLELTGLPPVLIHVGSTEVLELDALDMGDRLAQAGVPTRVKIWQGQVHDFQFVGVDLLPEARSAIAEIGEFVAQRTR
jgi:acetyl esterase/lipase